MNIDTMKSVRELMQITGADAQFERLLDALIYQVRQILGVPAATGADADPDVEQEFMHLRERLHAFRPEYETLYQELLLKYLGEEALAASAAAMSIAPVQRYFSAMQDMELELGQRLRELSQRMGETPIQA